MMSALTLRISCSRQATAMDRSVFFCISCISCSSTRLECHVFCSRLRDTWGLSYLDDPQDGLVRHCEAGSASGIYLGVLEDGVKLGISKRIRSISNV